MGGSRLPPDGLKSDALGAYLRRQRARLGAAKGITAAAHESARVVSYLMWFGEAYVKRTEGQYGEEVRQRLEKQLFRRARELGFEVVKAAQPEGQTPAEEVPAPAE